MSNPVDLSEPKVGLVIRYSFLWHRLFRAGLSEGDKDRPAVIIVATRNISGRYRVAVLPITHTEPKDLSVAVEIPLKVKVHLNLDSERSWVIVDEVNEFTWPGYDLRPVPEIGTFAYGMLPPKLFNIITEKIRELGASCRTKSTSRDE